jgi:aspartate dehydrogenase
MSAIAPRIAMIGYGAIGRQVAATLNQSGSLRVGAILRRASNASEDGIPSLATIEELIAWRPDLVVECAGHEAVATIVVPVLARGVATVLVSIGALCDPELRGKIEAAARSGGTRPVLVAGAIGGLDTLRAARLGGLDAVEYVGRKPPSAWEGAPGAERLAESALDRAVTIFEGDAANAARLYPKNANIAAAIALAGIGFSRTSVTLIADPAVVVNRHEIQARGAFGRLALTFDNHVMTDNPKTSRLAAMSVERAVRDCFEPLPW